MNAQQLHSTNAAPIPKASTEYNGTVDFLRLLAALSIVWFHVGLIGREIALAALPFFLMLQVFFGVNKPIRPQLQKILWPWAFWSFVYAVFKCMQGWLQTGSITAEFEWWMLTTGPALHLWYLPFSFCAIVIATHLYNRFSAKTVVAASVLISLPCVYMLNTMALPIPLAQWLSVVPALFLGVFLKSELNSLVVLIITAAACTALVTVGGYPSISVQTGAACAAIAIATLMPTKRTVLSRWSARVSFGVYLIHPAIGALIASVITLDPYWFFAIVSILSVVSTHILTKVLPKSV